MNERINNSEQNNNEFNTAEFLEKYPLPEGQEDKSETAIELKKIYNKLLDEDKGFTVFKNFQEQGLKLKEKYKTNAREYYLFHLLIGSTKIKTFEFDFPGEDSIEKFLRSQSL
ncbi:hypothetical protein KJ671_02405 [Patescibacteria group bacterium]|nr:hypothetical protein [Patescibacteria group bacterium]